MTANTGRAWELEEAVINESFQLKKLLKLGFFHCSNGSTMPETRVHLADENKTQVVFLMTSITTFNFQVPISGKMGTHSETLFWELLKGSPMPCQEHDPKLTHSRNTHGCEQLSQAAQVLHQGRSGLTRCWHSPGPGVTIAVTAVPCAKPTTEARQTPAAPRITRGPGRQVMSDYRPKQQPLPA